MCDNNKKRWSGSGGRVVTGGEEEEGKMSTRWFVVNEEG